MRPGRSRNLSAGLWPMQCTEGSAAACLDRLFGAAGFVWNRTLVRRTSAYQADRTRPNRASRAQAFTGVCMVSLDAPALRAAARTVPPGTMRSGAEASDVLARRAAALAR